MTKKQRYFVAAMLVLASLSVILFTFQAASEGTPILDRWASPFVAEVEGTAVESMFRWITELGSSWFLYTIAIIAGLILRVYYKDSIAGVMLVSGVAAGYGFNFAIKHLVQRERPRILESVDGTGLSYPSGHAMVSVVTYSLLVYFLMIQMKSMKAAVWIIVVGLILVLLIGFSRYVLRVHYLTDVMAGFSFGILVVAVWISLYHIWKRRKESSPT
ncbi:phosphatase PAP2 family protein [Thalassobacillus devorans]|uniref:phosphatase PAP2 family protein n=1 Tax=Thalassobacillus devorans TaxID=279813 RepID=UPI001594B2F7|nr:phosphatase PAP2 family protein [Thalassobacillus devorans]